MLATPLIRRLTLRSFLSYGSRGQDIGLTQLNVLIGSNASGKTNLLEAFRILQATPRDLAAAFRAGGGAETYFWKGGGDAHVAEVQAVVARSAMVHPLSGVVFRIGFSGDSHRYFVVDEKLHDVSLSEPVEGEERLRTVYYDGSSHPPVINAVVRGEHANTREFRRLQWEDLTENQSILAQRRDPDTYPEISRLARQLESIRVFPEGSFSRAAEAGRADLPADFLLSDGSNLGLILNDFQHRSETRAALLHYLQRFYPSAQFVVTKVHAGTVQTYIDEGFPEPIPATRLSSGTLRYLCLLAILCHPSPPPLVCLEEPELGLHPDILPTIAELLIQASQRTQLIVTTHSDALVSALPPESIIVCERDQDGSHLRRLDPEQLRGWLDEYSLGDIWRMGGIGGTRW